MSESYGYLDSDELRVLWDHHKKNLFILEQQLASYATSEAPLNKLNDLANERRRLQALEEAFARLGESPQQVDLHKNIGRQLYNLILLEDEQRSLLGQIAAAQRSIPREERRKFIFADSHDGASLLHDGFAQRGIRVYAGDLEALARAGLLAQSRGSRGNPLFDVTPQGFAYIDYIQSLQSEKSDDHQS